LDRYLEKIIDPSVFYGRSWIALQPDSVMIVDDNLLIEVGVAEPALNADFFPVRQVERVNALR
jgi:hypothetical protein